MIEQGKCCGCSACENICPINAISMKKNIEGFMYASVDEKKCIHCERCSKICPMIRQDFEKQYETPKVYGVKHKNTNVRLNSRSGGIFTAISDYILKNNGVVYGCRLNEEFEAVHDRAVSYEVRDLFRGSKYVQSDTRDIVKRIKEDIKQERMVLFSGTSCQVSAIKNCLSNQERKKVILVDIICHGVPSPLIWKEYLKYSGKKYGGRVTNVDFRNKKKYGWDSHIETVTVDEKEYDSRIYTDLFYGHSILRESCYQCPYKQIKRISDITLADFWGIDNALPGFNDNQGVSLVMINNMSGERVFEEVKNDLVYCETSIEKCMQPPLKRPENRPVDRDKFWKQYQTLGFEYIVKKYTSAGLIYRIKKKLSGMRISCIITIKKILRIPI